MVILLFYAILSAACFYLGSRALITRWLWRLYPPTLARFMDCSACTGFWWGVVWSATLGAWFKLDSFLPAGNALTPFVTGLCMIVLTPIVGGLMQTSLDHLGVIETEQADADQESVR